MDIPEGIEDLTDDQKHELFIKTAVESGVTDAENAEKVWDIVHNLSPIFPSEQLTIVGLPAGESAVRVAREYDAELEEAGLPGYTQIQVFSELGVVKFNVKITDLIGGLTVEVPRVSPPKARQES
jgi:hypothetical protein